MSNEQRLQFLAQCLVRPAGAADNGLPLYLFRYKAGGGVQVGVMAQDVLKVNPDAVVTMPSGFYAVDYEKALLHG